MIPHNLRKAFFEGSRGRVISLLRRGGRTVEELAVDLWLSANAIRVQLAGMERDGLVQRGGLRRGATRPSRVFELTRETESLLSRAYIPLLSALMLVFTSRIPPKRFESMMKEVGQALAAQLPVTVRPGDTVAARIAAASRLLNEELGATTEVERTKGQYIIRGHGCPLSAVMGKSRGICVAVESLLESVIQRKVVECCDRRDRPSCCFYVTTAHQ